MPANGGLGYGAGGGSEPDSDDGLLIAAVSRGDEIALRKLIDRYDRLVRYTVFRATKDRCAKDPQWLETMASNTWAGFVTSMRRSPGNRPRSLRAYLVRIARNQVASALRTASPAEEIGLDSLDAEQASSKLSLEEPGEILQQLELIEVVRECFGELDGDDRTLAGQLEAITDRRWLEAAGALGLSESTLRSRWKRVLDRLRRCVERKSGLPVAPGPKGGDQS